MESDAQHSRLYRFDGACQLVSFLYTRYFNFAAEEENAIVLQRGLLFADGSFRCRLGSRMALDFRSDGWRDYEPTHRPFWLR
ncbi:hypothetical protein D3C85_1406960 [compost metagenome]